MSQVLVVNKSYQFLQFVTVRKAIKLVVKGKAEIVEKVDDMFMQTMREMIPIPSVIRLLSFINFAAKPVSFTRRRVLTRDKFTCQYCKKRNVKMTIDHVIPQSKGGKSTWENCVAACIPCNKRKGNKSLEEVAQLGMVLDKKPKQPSFVEFLRCCAFLADEKTAHKWSEFIYI